MIELYFDGCVQPINPGGHGGYGFVVKKNGETIHQNHGYSGRSKNMTNNVAEYCGLIEGMNYLKSQGMTENILFKGDSQLVIQQMSKKWKIKRGAYLEKALEAYTLLTNFINPEFEWIPREENVEADVLSKIGATDFGR